MNEYQTKYLNTVKTLALKHIPNDEYAVFLFGSWARNKQSGGSDLDIGVLGNKPLPARIKFELELELEESIVPYNVDIVDFSQVDETFRRVALKDIIVWNRPKSIAIN